MRRLPSLAGVEAFVHVARLGSVKAAAEELALSSPALSRRIQSLERFVGRPLFERRHQAIVTNEDGEKLMHLVGPILDSLTDAIETLTSPSPVMRLRLGVLPLLLHSACSQGWPNFAKSTRPSISMSTRPPMASRGLARGWMLPSSCPGILTRPFMRAALIAIPFLPLAPGASCKVRMRSRIPANCQK